MCLLSNTLQYATLNIRQLKWQTVSIVWNLKDFLVRTIDLIESKLNEKFSVQLGSKHNIYFKKHILRITIPICENSRRYELFKFWVFWQIKKVPGSVWTVKSSLNFFWQFFRRKHKLPTAGLQIRLRTPDVLLVLLIVAITCHSLKGSTL